MPKISKLTKEARNRAVIAGVRRHAAAFDEHGVGPRHLKSADLVALFEEHLAALEQIAEYDRMKSDAILREARLEAYILEIHELIKSLVRGQFGQASSKVRDFAMKPRGKPKTTVSAKAVAVAKRKATRQARGTRGRKQRLKIKGWS